MGRARKGDLAARAALRQLNRIYIRYSGICQICFKPCAREIASREHVIELSKGGSSDDNNVVLAHVSCNNLRSKPNSKNHIIPKPYQDLSAEQWEQKITNGIKSCIIKQSKGLHPTTKPFKKDKAKGILWEYLDNVTTS
jgi:5-methylcytosine-specific restriction endonuclease McrA